MKQQKIDEVVNRILCRPSVPSMHRRGVHWAWAWLAALGWSWAAVFFVLWLERCINS